MKLLNKKHKNNGSALIIVIVLLMLLAVVGFTFVMLGRLDSIGGDAALKSQQMDSAADYLVERIATIIAEDADPVALGYGYDYPDSTHSWLANIEPYFDEQEALSDSASADNYYKYYRWRQISDIFGLLGEANVKNVKVDPPGNRQTIDEYQSVSDVYEGSLADADGDGVADSKWFRLPHLKTTSGEYYYAAVRIIDNSGMINVNTAYSDGRANYQTSPTHLFYGDSQLSVNLKGLIHSDDDIEDFFNFRGLEDWSGTVNPTKWNDYREDVVLRLSNPAQDKDWRVFTISDELALRNRFCINGGYNTRLEQILPKTLNRPSWTDGWGYKYRPYMGAPQGRLVEWCLAITGDGKIDIGTPAETTIPPANRPDRRHLLTTMSKSRELTPVQIEVADLAAGMEVIPGRRKAYINLVEETLENEALTLEQLAGNIYYAIKGQDFKSKFGNYITNERIAWNFALNLVDYQDEDSIPSVKQVGDKTYFGFEGIDSIEAMQKDALIVSGLAYYDNTNPDIDGIAAEKYYAITIYNPANESKRITNLNNYILTVFDSGGNEKYKINIYRDIFNSINTEISGKSVFSIANIRDRGADHRAFSDAGSVDISYNDSRLTFEQGDTIFIHKQDWPHGNMNMPVDRCEVVLPTSSSSQGNLETAQRQTEIGTESGILLGSSNSWTLNVGGIFDDVPTISQSIEVNLEVQNAPINIGEIGNVFAIGAYSDPNVIDDMTFVDALEEAWKLNPSNTIKNWGRFDFHIDNDITAILFDYLTAYNISWDGINTDGNLLTSDKPDKPLDDRAARDYETVVHGRININTAPPKVLEQLPFITEELAAIIAARRDAQILYRLDNPSIKIADYISKTAGYKNIAEVLEATINRSNNWFYDEEYDIQRYGQDGIALSGYPDFMPDDIIDDYKERDILFQRISNCIDVRSDVFTAYILLRAGADGPQKRLIATFDRSNVYEKGDTPKIIVQQAFLLGRN